MARGLYFGMEPGDFDFANPPDESPDAITLERALKLRQQMDELDPVLSGIDQPPTPADYGRLPEFGEPDMSESPGPPSKQQTRTARREAGVLGPKQKGVLLGLEALSNLVAIRDRKKARQRDEIQPGMPGFGLSAGFAAREREGRAKVKSENERRRQAEAETNRKGMDSYQQRKAATLRSVLPTVAASVFKEPKAPTESAYDQERGRLRAKREFGVDLGGSERMPAANIQELDRVLSMPPGPDRDLALKMFGGDGSGGSPWLDRMLADRILHHKDPMGLGRDTVPQDVATQKALAEMEAIKGAMQPRPSFANVEAGGSTSLGAPPPQAAPGPQQATPPPGPHLRNAPPQIKQQALMGYQNAVRADPEAREILRQDFMNQFGFDPEQQ